jgi:hypothetical protein
MFNFFFIRRYRNNVLTYINSVFDPTASSTKHEGSASKSDSSASVDKPETGFSLSEDYGTRYSLSDDDASSSPFLSGRSSSKIRIRYSRKATASDSTLSSDSAGQSAESEKNGPYADKALSGMKFQKKEISSDVKYSERGFDFDSFDSGLVMAAMRGYLMEKAPAPALNSVTNLTFVQKLQHHLRTKKLIETNVYKAALMDRRLFSKIMSDKYYKPSKDTALALVLALRLDLNDAIDMLERAGYTLSHSIKRDIIIEYFIKENIYNLHNINAFLYNMDEKIIGRSV